MKSINEVMLSLVILPFLVLCCFVLSYLIACLQAIVVFFDKYVQNTCLLYLVLLRYFLLR